MTTKQEKFWTMIEQWNEGIIGHREMGIGLFRGAIAGRKGANTFIVGPPGTGKTAGVNLFVQAIAGATTYSVQVCKDSTKEQFYGPLDLPAFKKGQYKHITKSTILEAHFPYLDELYDGPQFLLRGLNTVLADKQFNNGGEVMDLPLISAIGTSNFLPEDPQTLNAFHDRFLQKFEVDYIRDRTLRRKMLGGNQTIPPLKTTITLDELYEIQEEVENIIVPDAILDLYDELDQALTQKGIKRSDRRYKWAIRLLQANAWMNSRDEVSRDDFIVLQHVLWDDPEEKKVIMSVLLDFISPVVKQAYDIYDAYLEQRRVFFDTPEENRRSQAGIASALVEKGMKDLDDLIDEMEKLNYDSSQFIKIVEEMANWNMEIVVSYLKIKQPKIRNGGRDAMTRRASLELDQN